VKNESNRPAGQGPGSETKEPFIAPGDRPEVRLSLDSPIGDLSVRDLVAILGEGDDLPAGIKDFFDKSFPEVSKLKDYKEKVEGKEGKDRPEKWRVKELIDQPARQPASDTAIERLIQTVSGLTKQVGQLADQVEALEKRAR